jgi:hypothetical protein
LVEQVLADQRLVARIEDLVAPADAAQVGRVGEYAVNGGVPPAGRRGRRCLGAQALRDRDRAGPLADVQLEDAPHDRRGDGVGQEQLPLAGVGVARRVGRCLDRAIR